MAHFAQINSENIVTNVIVIDNNDCNGGEFPNSEPYGQDFIKNTLKLSGTWLQTSYNHKFRGRYAGKGMIYNEGLDIFEYEEEEDDELS